MGAIADYTAAIKLNPSHAPAYLNRGLARTLQVMLAEAKLDFDECLRLDQSLKPLLEERLELITQHLRLER